MPRPSHHGQNHAACQPHQQPDPDFAKEHSTYIRQFHHARRQAANDQCRRLQPDVAALTADYGRLAASLDLHGLARLRHLTLPRLRRPLAFAAGLAAALSVGDLGVIALFSDPAQATLPMLLYQRMGQYRMDEAYGIAILLIGLSLGLFWAFDRMGHADADA